VTVRDPWTQDAPGLAYRGAFAAILAIAAWLRLAGLGFGLPAVYNPDEVAIMSRALAFATGDPNPHNFLYPSFYFYVLFAWTGLAFVVSRLTGAAASLDAFQARFFVDPSSVYLAGRLLGVVCGVGGVMATWALARRLFGRGAALGAAAFLAVAPTAVRDAHYVKHDVPVTLLVVLAMLAMARVWPLAAVRPEATPGRGEAAADDPPGTRPQANRRAVLAAGALAGAAASTHYYAIFLIAPLALACVWQASDRRAAARTLAAAGGAAIAAFFLLSPFILVEPATAWHDIVANRRIVIDRAGAGRGVFFASAPAYARMLWTEGAGWPVVLLAASGAWLAARLSWRVTVWLLAFPTAFCLFISNTVAASRYLNPVLPFLAVLGGLGASALASRAGRRRAWVGAALVVAATVPGARDSWRVGSFFRQDDTRTLARRFIEEHVPAGSTVLLQPYSVPLVQSRESLVEALTARLGDASRASTKFRLRLATDPWPEPAYRLLFLGEEPGLDADKIYLRYADFEGPAGLDVLIRHGVQVVVLKRYNGPDSVTTPLLATLERGGRRIAEFSPYRPDADPVTRAAVAPFLHNTDTPLDAALARPGPVVEVWAVDRPVPAGRSDREMPKP
jgi:hypothetical protein